MKDETIKILKDTIIQWKKEYEILDSIIEIKDAKIKELKADIKELGSIIECKNGTIATLAWARDNLKAENKRLQEEVIHQKKINQELIIKYVKPYAEPTLNTELFDKNYKLRQTLQEIKKIAEVGMHCEGVGCDFMPKILQKISEVEE